MPLAHPEIDGLTPPPPQYGARSSNRSPKSQPSYVHGSARPSGACEPSATMHEATRPTSLSRSCRRSWVGRWRRPKASTPSPTTSPPRATRSTRSSSIKHRAVRAEGRATHSTRSLASLSRVCLAHCAGSRVCLAHCAGSRCAFAFSRLFPCFASHPLYTTHRRIPARLRRPVSVHRDHRRRAPRRAESECLPSGSGHARWRRRERQPQSDAQRESARSKATQPQPCLSWWWRRRRRRRRRCARLVPFSRCQALPPTHERAHQPGRGDARDAEEWGGRGGTAHG